MEENESEEEGNMEENTLLDQVVMPPSKISEEDRLALELAAAEKRITLAEAKTALSNSEKSELAYRYLVLQLYRKYGLSDKDALGQDGSILLGGAIQANRGTT